MDVLLGKGSSNCFFSRNIDKYNQSCPPQSQQKLHSLHRGVFGHLRGLDDQYRDYGQSRNIGSVQNHRPLCNRYGDF